MQLDDFTKKMVEEDESLTGLYKELLRLNLEAQILAGKKNIESLKMMGKKEKKANKLGMETF